MGAALAQALRGQGETLVIDAGSGGATAASFGWINASFHHDAAHFALRARGMAAWRDLCADLALPVAWCGALWWEEQGAALEDFAARLDGLGYPVERLSGAALADRLGPVAQGPDAALFFPSEGIVDATSAARALLVASGAVVLRGVAALGLVTQGGRVTGVRVEGGVIAADQVVVAAGTGAAALAQDLGLALPMLRRPGVRFRARAPRPLTPMAHVMVMPEMEVWMDGQGRLVAPTSPAHQGDATEVLPETPLALAEAALARLSARVGQPLVLDDLALALRPVPGDGLPVIGPGGPEWLYWAVMHSGVTLAPVAAQLLARAMATGQPQDALAPYRLDRFRA